MSLLLLAPLILILIFVIIFTIIILRDFLKDRITPTKKEPKRESKETEHALPEGKRKEKEPRLEEKTEPSMLYLSELNKLKKNLESLPAHDAYDRLMKIIRTFFSELLQIPPGFTFDELEQELKKKHKNIVFFSKNLSEICYNSDDISKGELKEILNEFEKIIKTILDSGNISTPEPVKFENKLNELLYKTKLVKPDKYKQKIEDLHDLEFEEKLAEKESKIKKVKKESKKRKEIIKEELEIKRKINALERREKELETPLKTEKRSINQLLREGNKAIKNNLDKAFDIYEQMYSIYTNLPKSKQKKIYPKITKFYNKIKNKIE